MGLYEVRQPSGLARGIEINWKPSVAERRAFARSLLVGFPCVALVLPVIGGLAKGPGRAVSALGSIEGSAAYGYDEYDVCHISTSRHYCHEFRSGSSCLRFT